jgi:hypothetical protein
VATYLQKVRVRERSWQKVDLEERALAVFSLLNFGEDTVVAHYMRGIFTRPS